MTIPDMREPHDQWQSPAGPAGTPSERQSGSHWGRLALIGVFTIGFAVYLYSGGGWLKPEALIAHEQYLLAYTAAHYWGMLMACSLLYVLATALSIPGAWMRSLVTGFLFGPWVGTVIIVFSATLGAVLTLLAARYLFADQLRARFEQNPKAARLIRGFHRDAFNFLLFLRIVPLFPFELVNLVPAFTPVSVRTFAVATAIGITPGSYALATLGQSLGLVQTAGNPLSPQIIILLVLIGLLVLVPVIIKRCGTSRTRGNK